MENVAGDYFDTENYDGSEDELDDDVDSIASDEDYHDPGSDDDQSCPICLNDFDEQQIGLPNNCRHVFCVDCILEWSKNANSCPVDRKKFQSLRVYHRFAGLYNREVFIQDCENKADDDAYEIETLCEICNRGDNEETLLLCDGCDAAYHCACLTPSLDAVPAGEWFCDRCKEQRRDVSSSAQPRLVGRTNLSERVRSRISQARRRHAENYSTLDEQLDAIVDEILRNASHRFRETTPSFAARQRNSTKTRRQRSRRRTRKRKRGRSNSRKPNSTGDDKSTSFSKQDVKNMHSFSVTGRSNDLNDFDIRNANDDELPSHVIAQRHRLLTQSAIQFNRPLPSLFSLHAETSFPPLSPPPPMPDLLSSILTGQELLFTPSNQVTIQRGGDLKVNQKKKSPVTSNKQVTSPPNQSFSKRIEATETHLYNQKQKVNVDNRKVSEKNPSKSKEVLPVPPPASLDVKSHEQNMSSKQDFKPVDEPKKIGLTRTSVSSNTPKPSIMIKQVFSLPTVKKLADEVSGSWKIDDFAKKEEVYDPFRPTESDEEGNTEDKKSNTDENEEKSQDHEEKTKQEVQETETKTSGKDENKLSSKQDSTASLAKNKEDIFAESPKSQDQEEVESKTEEPLKKAEFTTTSEDDFQIDLFAEEELEKAQAKAALKATETVMPDPLKLWRDEVRQVSQNDGVAQVTLPTFDLKTKSPTPEAPKFKKIIRKDSEETTVAKVHYRSKKTSSSIKSDEKKLSKEVKNYKKASTKKSKSLDAKDNYKKASKGPLRDEKAPNLNSGQHIKDAIRKKDRKLDERTDVNKKIEGKDKLEEVSKSRKSDKQHQSKSLSKSDLPLKSSNTFRSRSPVKYKPSDHKKKSPTVGEDFGVLKKKKRKRQEEENVRTLKENAKVEKVTVFHSSVEKKKERKESSNNGDELSRLANSEDDSSRSNRSRITRSPKPKKEREEKVFMKNAHISTNSEKVSFVRDEKRSLKKDKLSPFKKKKRRTRSSSSSDDENWKRKKKKRASSKRSRSRSWDKEEKRKRKKRKRSRSPKKKSRERKGSKESHKKNRKQLKAHKTLSFENIFADFDDLKKETKRKSKSRHKSDDRESTEFEEEEISVIYEYESLSEGEIVSSDEELERIKVTVNSTADKSNKRKPKSGTKSPKREKHAPLSVKKTEVVNIKSHKKLAKDRDISSTMQAPPSSRDIDDLLEHSLKVASVVKVVKPVDSSQFKETFTNIIDKTPPSPVPVSSLSQESFSEPPEFLGTISDEGKTSQISLNESNITIEDEITAEKIKSNSPVAEKPPELILPESDEILKSERAPGDESEQIAVEKVLTDQLISASIRENAGQEMSPTLSLALSIQAKEDDELSSVGNSIEEEVTQGSFSSLSPAAENAATTGADILPLVHYLKSLKQSDDNERALPDISDAVAKNNEESRLMKDQDVKMIVRQVDDSYLPPSNLAPLHEDSPLKCGVSTPVQDISEMSSQPVAPPLDYSPTYELPAAKAVSPLVSMKSQSPVTIHTDRRNFEESRSKKNHPDSVPVTSSGYSLISNNGVTSLQENVGSSSLTVKTDKASDLYSPSYPISPLSPSKIVHTPPTTIESTSLPPFQPSPTTLGSTSFPRADHPPPEIRGSRFLPSSNSSQFLHPPSVASESTSLPDLHPSSGAAAQPSHPLLATATMLPVRELATQFLQYINELEKQRGKTHDIPSTKAMSPEVNQVVTTKHASPKDSILNLSTTTKVSDSSKVSTSTHSFKSSHRHKAKEVAVIADSQKQSHADFQRKVVDIAKRAIMPYFKRRELSKEQYKGIMKKAVNKICKDFKGKTIDPEKIKKLIDKYVSNCMEINEMNKNNMRLLLNRKVDKHTRRKKKQELDFSCSPPSPKDSPDFNDRDYETNKTEEMELSTPPLPMPPLPPFKLSR